MGGGGGGWGLGVGGEEKERNEACNYSISPLCH